MANSNVLLQHKPRKTMSSLTVYNQCNEWWIVAVISVIQVLSLENLESVFTLNVFYWAILGYEEA